MAFLARSIFGTILIILGIGLLISLISHNPLDPSFSFATANEPKNVLGYLGSYTSGLGFMFLGISSYYYSLFLARNGYLIISNKAKYWGILKVSVALLIAPVASASFAAHFGDFAKMENIGGYIGAVLASELNLILKTTYWNVIGLLIFIFGASYTLEISLLSLIRIGYTKLEHQSFMNVKHDDASANKESFSFKILRKTSEAKQPAKAAEIITAARAPSKTKIQPELKLIDDDYELPSTSLLKPTTEIKRHIISESALAQNSKILQQVLDDFGIKGEIIKIHPGPVVTLYEFEPAAGVKSSRVIGLSDDIARSMSALSARISIIPGKSSLGIELPNSHREIVLLRELLESADNTSAQLALPLILGKNIGGDPIVADLAKMPHLLVAGTTGSGKSVAINTMILSLLYKYSPNECKFIMIDPKMLELSIYDGIPHLLAPVVTESHKAVAALKWVVKEMENRYRMMSTAGVRNLDGYNKEIIDAARRGVKFERQVQVGFDLESGKPKYETVTLDSQPLPLIVVIVDEMADLMIVAGKEIEGSIQRLAQMARAAGIHIIMATQRPSVDVITGVIKANFPTRISFQVTSKIDSRTILGEAGAEQLLGMGDMLFMRGGGRIERVHGPFVSDKEVESITSFIKAQGGPKYNEDITTIADEDSNFSTGDDVTSSGDELYDQALAIVLKDKKASTSYIQRCLRIGYNRAANIIERMEREGIITSPNHVGKREVILDKNN